MRFRIIQEKLEHVDVFKSRWQHHCGSLVQLFEQWVEIVSERAQIILISLHPHFQVSWFKAWTLWRFDNPYVYEIMKEICENMTAISEIV